MPAVSPGPAHHIHNPVGCFQFLRPKLLKEQGLILSVLFLQKATLSVSRGLGAVAELNRQEAEPVSTGPAFSSENALWSEPSPHPGSETTVRPYGSQVQTKQVPLPYKSAASDGTGTHLSKQLPSHL